MKNKAISKTSKIMIAGQFVLIIGIFIFVYFFTPRLIYPGNGDIIEQKNMDFKFRNANIILIDNNKEFSSAKEINLNEINSSKILFEPGTYYWKAVGIIESDSRKFTISSNVGLELNETNKSLKNTGNTALNVSVEKEKGVSGLVILDVNVEYPVDAENKTIYRGEEYGK